MHETVETMSTPLSSVLRPEKCLQGRATGAFALKSRKCREGGGRYPVRDGVYLFLGQVSKKFERAKASLPVERSLAGVLS